jgi:hypothetical protein
MKQLFFVLAFILVSYTAFASDQIEELKKQTEKMLGQKIYLPQEAHNTIGEIPIIEQFDDGNIGGIPGYKNTRGGVTVYWGAMVSSDCFFR